MKIPATFSPSQFAVAAECRLRTVLEATRFGNALSSHPAAELGSALHKVLERTLRGELPRRSTPEEDVAAGLDTALNEAQQRLMLRTGGTAPDLRRLYPPAVWRKKRRVVLDLAVRYCAQAQTSRSASGPTRRSARSLADLPARGSWTEVQILVPELRLVGRVDVVEKQPGRLIIRDLKTGRVMDDSGAVLPHIEQQMRIYGTMARHVCPETEIELVVDDGEERHVSFDSAVAAKTEDWLLEVMGGLPASKTRDAAELAKPGEGCATCAYRHVCTSYQRAAVSAWSAESPHPLPFDTWGEIEAVSPRLDGLIDITIRDQATRLVRVFGVSSDRLVNPAVGQKLWMFGLRSRDRRGGMSGWRHPVNFFEVSDDDPYGRSWSLEVFTD